MNTAPLAPLQVLLGVARRRSFSAAARELRVTTSSVSQAVEQLGRAFAWNQNLRSPLAYLQLARRR